MQYKFLVDDAWRYNDQQPFARDDYGSINNYILVEEQQLLSPTRRMDIDRNLQDEVTIKTHSLSLPNYYCLLSVRHNAFELLYCLFCHINQASSSGSGHHDRVLQLLDSDIDISRRRLCMHLASHKIDELIPNSGKVRLPSSFFDSCFDRCFCLL